MVGLPEVSVYDLMNDNGSEGDETLETKTSFAEVS